WINRFGDFAFNLEAGEKGLEKRRAGRLLLLGDRKRRRERGDGGMRQQAERAIGRGRQLRIVEIHGVARSAVRQGRLRRRRRHFLGTENGRAFLVGYRFDVLANDRAAFRSEERRVGKECGSRWLPYLEKKKGVM